MTVNQTPTPQMYGRARPGNIVFIVTTLAQTKQLALFYEFRIRRDKNFRQ